MKIRKLLVMVQPISLQQYLTFVKLAKNILTMLQIPLLINRGKFTPGQHIPIISPEKGMDESVNFAFLGAWNFKKEILKKEKEFIKRGGRFITHVPTPRIISK